MAMPQMDRQYYYQQASYIRINDKSTYLIQDPKNFKNLLIWDIKGRVIDQKKLMIQNKLDLNKQGDYDLFIKNILGSLRYKVYLKVNDCIIK